MDDSCKINQERYRVFIEDVADGFYETNLNGDFLFFNDALCRIFGYPREEIQHRNYREFMDREMADRAYEDFNRIYETGRQTVDIIWEIICKDGGKRILEISAKLIRDGDGVRTGFRGMARDVTDRHLAREELKASEKALKQQFRENRRARRRFQALLEFLPDPLFVFNLDGTVAYLNPAFEDVFGWSLDEVKNRRIPFVPDELKEETRLGFEGLFTDGPVSGLETRRLTKDGRTLDIMLDAAIFHEKGDAEPAGQVIRLRNVTREKRMERTNQALFRIANALPGYNTLDGLLKYITREVRDLLNVEGASVILLDEEKKEFFFRMTVFDDAEAGRRMKEIRFPADKGVAGQVLRTRKPMVVPDAQKSPFFIRRVDKETGYITRDMLDVPIFFQDRFIGVLCAVNKKEGQYSRQDVDLLRALAVTVALPIENARIAEALRLSFEEVKALNRAKDRVLHHLSHELKTPLSILSASLNLLDRKLGKGEPAGMDRILDRARRNLNRLFEMQYRIEDILREKDYDTHTLMSGLVDACSDILEALVSEETGGEDALDRIIRRVDELFGPDDAEKRDIRLDRFVRDRLEILGPRFAHRGCRVELTPHPVPMISYPVEVMEKIVDGLIRNAVENTPDQGRIEIDVAPEPEGVVRLTVRDFGVGITRENRPLLFNGQFSTRATSQYASRQPFDFNAGGKGFDLLRMKIFSERYHFDIHMDSDRCRFIPGDDDVCAGDICRCAWCATDRDCLDSGGTVVTVRFPATRAGDRSEGDHINHVQTT